MLKKILVVEDEPLILDTLGKVIKALGLIPLLHNNPTTALTQHREEIAAGEIALVTTDCEMFGDEKAGFKFATEVKQISSEIPVVMFTGQHHFEREAFAYGIDAFFTKPVGFNNLMEYMRKKIKTS